MMNAYDHKTTRYAHWWLMVCVAMLLTSGCGMYPLGMGPPVGSGVSQVSLNDLKIDEASPLFYGQAFFRQYAMFNERMRGIYHSIITPQGLNQTGCMNTVGTDTSLRALRKGDARMENGSFTYSYSNRRDLPSAYFAQFSAPR